MRIFWPNRIRPESADPMAAFAAEAKRAATCKGEWLEATDWRWCLCGVAVRLVVDLADTDERDGEADADSESGE
jgi:hypothetical protein